MARPISKGAWVGIVFAIGFFLAVVYLTVGQPKVECEVCMEMDGRKKCLAVKGENDQQAMQTAKDNACSYITNGRAESFRCSQTPPASVNCKPL